MNAILRSLGLTLLIYPLIIKNVHSGVNGGSFQESLPVFLMGAYIAFHYNEPHTLKNEDFYGFGINEVAELVDEQPHDITLLRKQLLEDAESMVERDYGVCYQSGAGAIQAIAGSDSAFSHAVAGRIASASLNADHEMVSPESGYDCPGMHYCGLKYRGTVYTPVGDGYSNDYTCAGCRNTLIPDDEDLQHLPPPYIYSTCQQKHRLCQSCYNRRQQLATPSGCSVCGTDGGEWKQDNNMLMELMEVQVYCPKNCSAQGSLREIAIHLKNCFVDGQGRTNNDGAVGQALQQMNLDPDSAQSASPASARFRLLPVTTLTLKDKACQRCKKSKRSSFFLIVRSSRSNMSSITAGIERS